MLVNVASAILARVRILVPAAVVAGLLAVWAPGGKGEPADSTARPEVLPYDARFAPYALAPEHLWNRLHRALFVRAQRDGRQRVHSTDPLLYRDSKFLLEGEPHRRAVALLDELLAKPGELSSDDPLKRLFLQRDLWAAFDYAAWYPDDWVHYSRHEPAAIALRTRLAKVIGRLALNGRETGALPDNYALAVKSKQYASDHAPEHPERPFLPADLFEPAGPWVRFHQTSAVPMARRHFDEVGGRAVHVIFLRLPEGRAATEQYLKELGRDSVKQFPPGTMVAMVRRALAVDDSAKVRVTPVTELVQIRMYRRIPAGRRANSSAEFGEQDVYEFVLDRGELFAGRHGLMAVGPDTPAESFERTGPDPFEHANRPAAGPPDAQLKTCIRCHQSPGVYSVTSMERGLREPGKENFRTYAWDVETSYTMGAKVKQFQWGLLQGLLEANR
jgi:hypothetical protein